MPDQLLDNPNPAHQDIDPDLEANAAGEAAAAVPQVSINRSTAAELERRRMLHVQSAALVILASAAVLTLIYVGKLLLVVILVSILLSFVLAPIVDLLVRFQVPRAVAALLAVGLLVGALGVATYGSYSHALEFMHEVPKYKARIQAMGAKIREQAEQIETTTETVLPENEQDQHAVTVKQSSSWTDLVSRNASSVSELLLALTFIPFLVFFMLSWQDHVRSATVMLFDMENRNSAYVMLGLIASMIRSFIVGNFIIGVFLSACSIALFGTIGLPYFYFLGVDQRLPEPGSLPGRAAGDPAAVDCRSWTPDRRHRRADHRRGIGIAPHRHECALSQDSGQAPAAESAGGNSGAAVLGMAVGGHGADPGGADYRGDQDHLRPHRAGCGRMGRGWGSSRFPLFAFRFSPE